MSLATSPFEKNSTFKINKRITTHNYWIRSSIGGFLSRDNSFLAAWTAAKRVDGSPFAAFYNWMKKRKNLVKIESSSYRKLILSWKILSVRVIV